MYKYKRNGFTLVELMAVIIIISLIALLTFPNIINQIKKTKKSNNKMIEDVIIEQAKKYVNDNEDEFQDADGYCLSIETLVDNGYVKDNLFKNNDIAYDDVIMMIKKSDFSYKIVNKNNCDVSEYQNIFVDNEGKKYERLVYLESTGPQYIDTGFNTNTPEAGYYIKYQNYRDHSGDDTVMGVLSPNRGILTNYKKVGSSWKQSGVGADDSTMIDVLPTDIIETWLNYENNSISKISLNGEVQKSESISTVTSTNNRSCYIFASNFDSAYGMASGVRVYGAKITLNNEIVRDYIPVLDANNRPCMFDKVGKKCYYNQGTGEFQYSYMGKNIRKINYLESTGTQYIDTGFTSNTPEAGYYIKYQNSQDHSGDDVVMGVLSPNRAILTSNKKTSTTWKESGLGSDESTKIDVTSTNIIETWLNFENNNISKISLNGEIQKSENISTVTSTNNQSCYIFGANWGNVYGNASGVRVYGAKITLNNEIVRDYIPVLDKMGVPCLYDKVEGKFYYNQGTGDFLYG